MDKKRKKNIIIAAIVVAIALILYLMQDVVEQAYHSIFDERTEIGHVMLSDLTKTEKLTVLSLYKEVVVSQYKETSNMFLGSKKYQIHSVYPGRIDVGFDLKNCADDWLLMREDTAYVKLPAVEILNQGGWFIDEASRETPIEEGEWTNEDYARLSHRANALLKRNSELDDCYRMAEENGKRVVQNLLQAMGIKYVKIEVEPRDYYRPFTIDYDNTGRKGVHYDFYVNASSGNRYVKFDDGGLLSYQGDIDDEDLYSIIDMFLVFTQGKTARQWSISKQANHLKINMVNPTLTVGTKAADAFSRSRRKSDVARLETALRQLFGDNLNLTIVELDRKGIELHRY